MFYFIAEGHLQIAWHFSFTDFESLPSFLSDQIFTIPDLIHMRADIGAEHIITLTLSWFYKVKKGSKKKKLVFFFSHILHVYK